MKKSTFVAIIIAILGASIAAPVLAQGPITDDQVNEIAKDLYCPVCESTPLDVCATQACKDWREVIRGKLADGQTKDEITTYFVSQYGERVLAEPLQEGFTLGVWVVPIVTIVGAALYMVFYLRKLKGAAVEMSDDSERPDPTDDPLLAQLERELKDN